MGSAAETVTTVQLIRGNRMRVFVLWLSLCTVQAVIFFATSDPNFNTTPPSGELAESGWECQGRWGRFLGTAIAPEYFVTAKHVGGVVGDVFLFEDDEHKTIAFFDDPQSDLRICRVQGEFRNFAELYSREEELGESIVVFGRGTRRGAEVRLEGSSGDSLKGWLWGAADGRLRWGENQVARISLSTDPERFEETVPPVLESDFLIMTFDAGASASESHLSAGDSGGGVFVRDENDWKLAGVNFAVAGPYNTTNEGAGFQAAIFDESGLWIGGPNRWQQRSSDFGPARSGGFYSTRISSRLAWIEGILSQKGLGKPPVLQSAINLSGVFVDEDEAFVDTGRQIVEVDLPAGTRFYRLRGETPARIRNVNIRDGHLTFTYE